MNSKAQKRSSKSADTKLTAKKYSWKVDFKNDGKRLGQYFQSKFEGHFSQRAVKRTIEQGLLRVNGKIEKYTSRRIEQGDQIDFLGNEKDFRPENLNISKKDIIFEDEVFVVVNKPAGLPSNKIKSGWSVEQGLQHLGGIFRNTHLIHRLDRDTSGVLLFTKQKQLLNRFKNIFRSGEVKKTYNALVDGMPSEESRVLKWPLSLLEKRPGFEKWGVDDDKPGLRATTEYRVIESYKKSSYIEVYPTTGRTHQIRVHLSHMGHAILGDNVYRKTQFCPIHPKRQMLHASQLEITHPETEKKITFKANLPSDFKECRLKLKS